VEHLLPQTLALLERLDRDKHSSLLRKSVNYSCKSFIGLAPRVNLIKKFGVNLLTLFCKLGHFINTIEICYIVMK
jgi:hypothetical protein